MHYLIGITISYVGNWQIVHALRLIIQDSYSLVTDMAALVLLGTLALILLETTAAPSHVDDYGMETLNEPDSKLLFLDPVQLSKNQDKNQQSDWPLSYSNIPDEAFVLDEEQSQKDNWKQKLEGRYPSKTRNSFPLPLLDGHKSAEDYEEEEEVYNSRLSHIDHNLGGNSQGYANRYGVDNYKSYIENDYNGYDRLVPGYVLSDNPEDDNHQVIYAEHDLPLDKQTKSHGHLAGVGQYRSEPKSYDGLFKILLGYVGHDHHNHDDHNCWCTHLHNSGKQGDSEESIVIPIQIFSNNTTSMKKFRPVGGRREWTVMNKEQPAQMRFYINKHKSSTLLV